MFKQKMVTTAIPERVYVLCKNVYGSRNHVIKRDDLRSMMEPDYVNNSSSYFGEYCQAAVELGLVTISDGNVSLAVDGSVVETIDSMRCFANSRLKNLATGQFYQVTRAFFNMGPEALLENKRISDSGWKSVFLKNYGIEIDTQSLLAWRFWFSFLGFGVMHGMFPIPNPSIFLRDCIKNSTIEVGRRYSVSNFVDVLRPDLDIVFEVDNRSINYGVSCGLRTLHDTGVIKMEHILDQDTWSLHPMDVHSISRTITNITVNE